LSCHRKREKREAAQQAAELRILKHQEAAQIAAEQKARDRRERDLHQRAAAATSEVGDGDAEQHRASQQAAEGKLMGQPPEGGRGLQEDRERPIQESEAGELRWGASHLPAEPENPSQEAGKPSCPFFGNMTISISKVLDDVKEPQESRTE
jgi:hypothetical protein